jgi:hypothetical protein
MRLQPAHPKHILCFEFGLSNNNVDFSGGYLDPTASIYVVDAFWFAGNMLPKWLAWPKSFARSGQLERNSLGAWQVRAVPVQAVQDMEVLGVLLGIHFITG